ESTHAVTASPAWLAILVTIAHIIAAGVWTGGLLWIVYVGPDLDDASRARLAGRFGPLAALCVALLGLTGITMAALHLRTPSALVDRGYGRALVVKTLIVLAALACAYRAATRPRARRVTWWRLEALALLAVAGLAGLVVS